MGFTGPVQPHEQPTVAAILDAVKSKVEKDELCMCHILYSLNLAKIEDLWPGQSALSGNIIWMMWSASKQNNSAALNYIHARNIDNMKQSKKSSVLVSKGKKRKVDLPVKISPDKSNQKGRKYGSNTWSKSHIKLLLNAVEIVLLCVKDLW